MADAICIMDCKKPVWAKGLCRNHYQQWYQGAPLIEGRPAKRLSGEQRFLAKVRIDEETGCWIWTGEIGARGYGRFRYRSDLSKTWSKLGAHRVAYEIYIGPIPEGLTLDHLCHNADKTCPGGRSCLHRRCVNPAHLEPATRGENALRGKTLTAANRAKIHCSKGHPFAGDNLMLDSRGNRCCRTCRRAHWTRANQRRKR